MDKNKIPEESNNVEELEEDSKLKKFVVLLIGIFLLFLMFSFAIVTYPIGNILQGKIESNPLRDNVIELDEFSIIFEDKTLKELQKIYFDNPRVEFSSCLSGYKNFDNYIIGSLYTPEIFSQSYNHVNFNPCSEDTLIILHSHPYKSCIASTTDIRSLERTKELNPDVLMVIMCEPARFSVYS